MKYIASLLVLGGLGVIVYAFVVMFMSCVYYYKIKDRGKSAGQKRNETAQEKLSNEYYQEKYEGYWKRALKFLGGWHWLFFDWINCISG